MRQRGSCSIVRPALRVRSIATENDEPSAIQVEARANMKLIPRQGLPTIQRGTGSKALLAVNQNSLSLWIMYIIQ
jgi:hypothetical protein